jgi:serine O-acetyltransferase
MLYYGHTWRLGTGSDIYFLPSVEKAIMDMYPLLENALTRLMSDAELPDTALPPELIAEAHDDLQALLDGDPSMARAIGAAFATGSAFRALLAHRVASWLWNTSTLPNAREKALGISYAIRGETAIDIHPAARIGRRVVFDHGCGTVIGETASIGDECYILNGVLLGARGIANNAPGPRHPRIGNRCQIGSFAAVLGAVEIGDDCFIGPGVIVTSNVASRSRLTLRAIVHTLHNTDDGTKIDKIRRFDMRNGLDTPSRMGGAS